MIFLYLPALALIHFLSGTALGGMAVLKKVRALRGDLDAAERQALAGEIDKVREVLSAIAREVRGR